MFGFKYLENAQTVRAAAEGMFGGEWENLDISNDAMLNSGVPYTPNVVVRGVVTMEASAAEKTGDAPDFVWNAGIDGTFRVMALDAYSNGGSDDDGIVINDMDGNIRMESAGSGVDNTEDFDQPFINLSEETVEEDEVIELWYISQRWCYFGKPKAEVKRIRFKLTTNIQKDTEDESGYADAVVIDPLETDMSVGDVIRVWDPRKEFCFAYPDSIGWATKGISSVASIGEGGGDGGDGEGGSPGDGDGDGEGGAPAIGCCTFIDSNDNTIQAAMTEAACDGQTDGTWESTPCSGGGDEGEDRADEWIIESCTQLVTRVRGTLGGCLSPWAGGGQGSESGSSTGGGTDAVPEITGLSSESYWPYVMWGPEEQGGSLDGNVQNPQRFAARSGVDVWLERRSSNEDTQAPDGVVTPYDDETPDFIWNIIAVEREIANYAKITHSGNGEWELAASTSAEYFDGDSPNPCTIGAKAPEWYNGEENWCAVPADIEGIGRLDKDTGYYVLISTFSAFFGPGNLTKMVGSPMEDMGNIEAADALLYTGGDSPGNEAEECGNLKYKELKNVITFGSDEGTGCPMEFTDPDPEVEFSPYTATVVTGVTTDSNGDVALETKEIKVMCPLEDGDNIAIPHQQTDLVEDIYCSGDSIQKSYKTIRYIGKEVNSNTTDANLSDCIESSIDWEYVFDNYITNQDWYTVNYYDITYPEGCEPCPTGCCEQTLLDESVVYKKLTEGDCTASVVSNPTEDSDVVSADWTDEDCPETPCGCCKTTDGTGFVTYQEGLSSEECAALVTSPPTGSGADIVSAECIEECPGEPTGCCFVSEGDYRPGMTQVACVTGLGGTWSEGEDCPDVGCCTLNYTAGGTEDIITTQERCENYETTGIYEGQDVDTTEYAGDGTTCGTDCDDPCCCGSFADVQIQFSCPPGPGGPGGPGMPGSGGGSSSNVSWAFNGFGSVEGDGSCTWTTVGNWEITDDQGNSTFVTGSVTTTHEGNGEFTGSGSVDGFSFTLNSDATVTLSGAPCTNPTGQWSYNMDAEAECQDGEEQ